ncbi:pyridoxamine 5'-phosphate oxidase family protein [Spongiactinospora sp. TRM90649]|uniref:pyridoxamine 5'-phosphate oxidase family protein n=1 Tax=Spongiactinospora sp. TRM90649 TaxID=3031114 RepID=UPI0023F923CD|nr:pyridoxamine 5'-phosphate oxidase family protein [Spongiactinospora sp. TRM90649]MDF5754250.1 pyridoxamine 5'-phosphate oxidase family protein [Spongiactinospora sp. TRM90649]
MKLDSAGLQILDRDECLALLGTAPIGRVVFTDRALPAVQPVNYTLDGGSIVIRTGLGSKLAVAARNAVVAFEADAFDPAQRTGWSVTAVGHARAVTDPREIERLSRLPLDTWAPGSRDHYIVIRPERISGRRINRPGDF